MKISVRPLKGATFEVETQPDQKVLDLKKAIAAVKPEFPAELQKLIHAGKILVDGTSIGDHGIKPSDFVVVMVGKAKAPAAAAATTDAASAVAPASGAAPSPSPAPSPTPAPAAAAPSPAALPAPAVAPASQVGGAPESTVTQLCEMGFSRDQVIECLRAAFNNPDRAVEYLMTGIPERARSRSPRGHGDHGGHGAHGGGHGHGGHESGHDGSGHSHTDSDSHGAHSGQHGHGHEGHDAPGHDCSSHGHGDQQSGHGHGNGAASESQGHGHERVASEGNLAFPAMRAGEGGGSAASQALETLRQHPRFGELTAMVLQNPSVLPQMLQALAQTNPELAQAITANQDEFLQMLEGAVGDDDDDDDDDEGGHGHSHGEGDEGAITVEVSEADQAAVTRLAALGFTPELALEAYLACDRKEELAANFLFESQEN
eukprot:TRINITY_DN94744_c0_g1_i1.p1 TRINITY_DN94744_c0_g1~~TRINITY_DN94744_c0_g1_i1.p1  ORF type:complete len:430 (-),score=109.62 TRINITY_DN94744_c0_g1_i1:53-1342(-)